MSLEEFRRIKQAMFNVLDIYKELNKLNEQTNDIAEENLLKQYFELQEQLLNNDLSNIPFEEWKGMNLVAYGELDLSKTHANIDFSLLESVDCDRINLKGCKVKNIQTINYDETTFDEQFIKEHPELFPKESLPKEIKNKFYHHELEFSDLLKYPTLKVCINEYSFGSTYTSFSGSLVQTIGLENAMKMFDENPMFIISITTKDLNYLHSGINFASEHFNKNNISYKDVKNFVYRKVIDAIKEDDFELPSLDIIPDDMKQEFPNVFIKENEFPQDVIERYYAGNLTLVDIREHRDTFIIKDLKFGTRHNYGYAGIVTVFGNVWNFFEEVPPDVSYIVAEHISKIYSKEELNQLANKETTEIIAESIKKHLELNNDADDIYTINKYCHYLSPEEVIQNVDILNFVKKCGIENLQKYNEEHGRPFDFHGTYLYSIENTLLGRMSIYAKEFKESIESEKDLTVFLDKIIYKMRESEENIDKEILSKNKKELSLAFPSQFIDYNLLDNILNSNNPKNIIEKLENGFNGNIESLLQVLNEYPEMVSTIENKKIIIDTSSNTEYKQKYQQLHNCLGNKRFLEMCAQYGMSLPELLDRISKEKFNEIITELQNNEDYEHILNNKFHEIIFSKRTFDIRMLPDSFKKMYPELYLKDDAPDSLSKVFYINENAALNGVSLITPKDIQEHPEWIPFLMHINLAFCLEKKDIGVYNSNHTGEYYFVQQMSLYQALAIKFSQEEILQILSQYGEILWNETKITLDLGVDKSKLYNDLLEQLYKQIVMTRSKTVNRKVSYEIKNMPDEFKQKYPDIFLSEDAPLELQNIFYQRKITPMTIKLHPEWIPFLLDKNLSTVCDSTIINFVHEATNIGLENNQIFNLFNKYGNYLSSCNISIKETNKNDLEDSIEKQIVESITKKLTPYDDSAKEILGNKYPELFLEDNAPEELKQYFYNSNSNTPLTFDVLKQHKEWMPFIQDKNVLLSLKKKNIGIRGLEQLFEKYGQEQALKIGMKNPESVMKMLEGNKFELLSQWYDKLNFIPHYVVMLDFPVEQSDKFVSSGKKWSQLMRIERHNLNEESKSALLKASMCFGVFDNDIDGFNKTIQLFTEIPKTLTEDNMKKIIQYIENEIKIIYSNITDIVEENKLLQEYNELLELLKKTYQKNDNGTYRLKINIQQNKEIVNKLRVLMEKSDVSTILTTDKAHKLFGGFAMKYEPDFRDFILNNMDTILESDEYITYISSMQKQWLAIKAVNSNRTLTLDLALAFVKSNSYENVQIGNEKLAEVSNQAGYSQQDFETLQQIYNYGKIRTFNSIPRIQNTTEEYNYEVLRLDDPLALAIGTLTDCCQELGNAAETSMEHSMVDKHGRGFVIKDKDGNIVAQSWVWRNKNVVCFDNIEIPNKAFTRAEKSGQTREQFTDIIYLLYQQAAQELIEKDEKTYLQLLKDGKITQEQFESLKIGKVTVGTGYNDIAAALKKNAKLDVGTVSRPLEFIPPVELQHRLYTHDSEEQYIIAGKDNVTSSNEQTPTIYQNEFAIYDDTNTTQMETLTLQKLEYVTKQRLYAGRTQTDETENIVSNIAYNYGLDPETTRIVMDANFAIIYDIKEDEIIIGDILYNTKVFIRNQEIDITDKVVMQIRMALEQISIEGKQFNINNLNQQQTEMYNKAMNLNEEIDQERGISHGSR